jgi:hypothetical protein
MAYKTTARKADTWIQSIIINDEDLMFHHKPLSTWFEEQHQQIRNWTGEERRGRERERRLRGESPVMQPKSGLISEDDKQQMADCMG